MKRTQSTGHVKYMYILCWFSGADIVYVSCLLYIITRFLKKIVKHTVFVLVKLHAHSGFQIRTADGRAREQSVTEASMTVLPPEACEPGSDEFRLTGNKYHLMTNPHLFYK